MLSCRWAVAVPMIFLLASASAAPRLDAHHPIGYERGKTLTLSLFGRQLAGDMEIISAIPGTATLKPVDMPEGKPAYDPNVRRDFEITIPSDAPVGLYPVRVRTPLGISNQVLFSVGSLPDLAEAEPNNLQHEAQPIELGRCVFGTIAPADRDLYKINLSAGTRVVAEVESSRLALPLDSYLTLWDDRGRELASNDDALGLAKDSRLDVTIPKDGLYTLGINDVNYTNSANYRLKIGSYEYAEGLFPQGGSTTPEAKTWTWRREHANPQPILFSASGQERWTMVHPFGPQSPTLPIRYFVSTAPEMIETEGALTDLKPGTTMNGRIGAPGEKDKYRLTTSPGKQWRFQLQAARIGSQLDGTLTIENAEGQTLVRSVDQVDPVFDFTTPDAVQEVRVVVEDLQGRGGPSFPYRLRAEDNHADFKLEITSDTIDVPQGAREIVPVRVTRRGYDGPIQLFLPESVEGVTAEEGLIPAGQNEGILLIAASEGTPPKTLSLEIWGRGGAVAQPMDRQARGASVNLSPFAAADLQIAVPAAICLAPPLKVELSTRDIAVAHGSSKNLDVTIARGEGVTEDVRVVPRTRTPSFPAGLELTIAKDKSAGTITFSGDTNLGLSKGTMLFEAITNVAGQELRVPLPPVVVALVRPFSVENLQKSLSVKKTDETILDVVVRRKSPFSESIKLRLADLPKGASAEEIVVPSDQSLGKLKLISADTPPGDYTIHLVASTEMPGRKKEKDYTLPAIDITLKVSAEDAK